MPSDHQHLVAGDEIAQDIGVRKDSAEHERPGDDPALVDWFGRKEVAAAKCCFGDERAGNAVGDGIHELELAMDYMTESSEAPLGSTRPIWLAAI